jgi:Zn-dependent peptidase ImmA (M78 family)/transcriptional regulator with XRE-family HTH domain
MFENGKKVPGSETLAALARALAVPATFFLSTPERPPLKGVLNFRKLESATKRDRAKAAVRERWIADVMHLLGQHLNLPKMNVPDFGVVDFDTLSEDDIEHLAVETRRYWGLGNGPISNLTLLLENNGIVVSRIPLSAGLDAFSCWQGDLPIIVLGNKMPFARGRFDCGHELGHLVLHRAVGEDHHADRDLFKLIEKQAHRFGGALLVPRDSLAKELYSLSLDSLLALKRRWGVSMQALVYRAASLDLISQNQSQYLFRQISAAGYRRNEPLDKETQVEMPSMIPRAIRLLVESGHMRADDFVERLSLFPGDLGEITGIEASFFDRQDKVVPLTLRTA